MMVKLMNRLRSEEENSSAVCYPLRASLDDIQ